MLGNRLVIGLDYGTTYTGVSFCETSDTGYIEERIQIVQDWPAAHSMIGTKEKVPSEIAYLPGDTKWGSLIPTKEKRYMWTKLELDIPMTGEAEKIRQELSSLTIGGRAHDKRPVEIIADFLAEVKAQLIKNLDNQYGRELWMTLPITLVVTVPAVWSDAAKNRTLQAVSKAGFNTVELPQLKRTVTVTEPEAAAVYTLKSLQGSVKDDQLEVGDGFVICDMGGGTVDLISYRIAGTDPTYVEEVTVGTGAQCGGSFVDRAFLQWIEEKVGVHDFVKIAGCSAKDLSRTSLPPKLGRMVQAFTLTAKSGFSGCEKYYLQLPFPLSTIEDEERGMCEGEIRLTADDMKQMFKCSLERTKELLVEQLQQAGRNRRAKIKYIFMVGGFAESPYMYREISALAQAYGQIEVIKPAYAWSAIVRGATAKGLEGDGRTPIKSRMCRRHYGSSSCALFRPGMHREADSFIDEFTGKKRARHQMNWLITKGQELSTSDLVHGSIDYVQDFWPGRHRKSYLELLAADVDKAPNRSVDFNVYKVAEVRIDLSSVPENEFRTMYSPNGRVYHRLEFAVELSIQSVLEFTFSVNGKTYGSLTANYA